MPPLRFGIIGCGHFAERAIAPAIRSARNAELVAVQKRSLDAARAVARGLGAAHAFDRIEDLVDCPDVDAVFVVSTNARHAPDAILAAERRKHVLVEKPMAMDAAECRAMVEACAKADVRLMVGHMVRLSPAVRMVRDRVREGAVGRVTFARAQFTFDGRDSPRSWLSDRRLAGGGPLFDIAVHCLDTIRYVLGEEVEAVQAAFEPRPTADRTEQTSHLTLRFASGVLGSIYTSFETGVRSNVLQVMGTEGMLEVGEFTRSGVETAVRFSRKRSGMPDEAAVIPVQVPDLYRQEVEMFVASVQDGAAVPVPGEEGLRNQLVLDEAMRQATGRQPF